MTPEKLDELRKSAKMVQQIGIQNAAVCKHPYNGVNNASFALANLPALLAHIDAQAAQIEVLKKKLIHETAENNFYANNGMNPYDSFMDSEMKTEYLQEARQQLKAEVPDVEW